MVILALLSLATYRTWRLLGRDDITTPIRARLLWKPDGRIVKYIRDGWECPWCLGTWLAVLATYLVHRYVTVLHPHWLLWAAAVACVVGFLGEIDGKMQK